MKMQIVAARDVRVEAYMQPTFVPHTAAAVRAFTDHVRDPQSDFAKHPEDYELWWLGEYNDQDGSFTPPDGGIPLRLLRGLDAVLVKQ